MIKSRHSLQGRLLALVIGVVAVVWMIAGIATWFDVRHELDELLDSHLAQAAALLVVQQSGEIEDEHGVDTPTLHRYAPKVAFQVFHQGRLVLRSLNAPAAPMTPSVGDFRPGFATIQIGGMAWRVFATHGAEQDVQVFVGESTGSRDAILWAALRSTLWPMAVALPLLALALWWAIYGGLAPMRLLGQRLAQRQPQELHPFEFDGITSEMAPMVDSLNTLFKRIDILLESERRFTADAAHELRTPLAAIRAQAQVALGEADDSRRQVALRGTIDGCDRAARLVEQLLTLSRLEAAGAPAMTVIDLSALGRRTIAEIAPKAIAKNQQIELEAADHCRIRGDETLMEVLIRNLVDNAIRYSPPLAHIRVAMQETDGSVTLSVEDGGPGLEEVDSRRLGERFFRVSGSGESGSGLGWSIVRRIAALHRLDVQIGRSKEFGGLAIRLTSPSNGIVLDNEPACA